MPSTAEADRILASAKSARETADTARRDAVAARWMSAGARIQHRDLTVQLIWTITQVFMRREGVYRPFHPLPRALVRSLDR
jgi:hypothetical protein